MVSPSTNHSSARSSSSGTSRQPRSYSKNTSGASTTGGDDRRRARSSRKSYPSYADSERTDEPAKSFASSTTASRRSSRTTKPSETFTPTSEVGSAPEYSVTSCGAGNTSRCQSQFRSTRNRSSKPKKKKKQTTNFTERSFAGPFRAFNRHLTSTAFEPTWGPTEKGSSNYTSLWGDVRHIKKIRESVYPDWTSVGQSSNLDEAMSRCTTALSGVKFGKDTDVDYTGELMSSVFDLERQLGKARWEHRREKKAKKKGTSSGGTSMMSRSGTTSTSGS